MDLGLAGRVAIITGAGRGIGLAHARALGLEGVSIVINDQDSTAAMHAVEVLSAQGINATSQTGDATDPEVVNQTVSFTLEKHGRLDILINNAGIGVKPASEVEHMPLSDWQRMLHIHLDSTFVWSRAAVDPMRKNGYGRIINTSSMNFTGGGRPGVAHYSAAKAGIVGLTQTMAKEVAKFGLTVNAIAPGYVATELISQFSADMMDRLKKQNPAGRLCLPEEVAALTTFLASTHAGFINGELICMDGGRRDYYWG
ncbi:SDR family oxidoreductase [Pusillimonas sp. MFBS29]|uniref:SDR family NAD(P)-dependent oxidoreductase n=1 Tax=Pusillimonas sp. MFBS29 TaxID=2886690 RepID=UPI001D10C089|nr:SDR family NAD(P)-dependent oxidoreductase [Pusillimonas sp. MFBS29]MCC2594866.1 SDR family oxidoreductase [Pusillimonas sp. MFBS29]